MRYLVAAAFPHGTRDVAEVIRRTGHGRRAVSPSGNTRTRQTVVVTAQPHNHSCFSALYNSENSSERQSRIESVLARARFAPERVRGRLHRWLIMVGCIGSQASRN